MRMRLGSMSVLAQVAALVVFAVIASQAAVFATVLLAPPPRPAGFSIAAAADALQGHEALTSDGRTLRRHLGTEPVVVPGPPAPLEIGLTQALAARLKVSPAQVRVRIVGDRSPLEALLHPRPGPGPGGRLPEPQNAGSQHVESFVFSRRETGPPSIDHTRLRADIQAIIEGGPVMPMPPGSEGGVHVITSENRNMSFSVAADRLTFAPFVASVRQADGRWATVEPPRGLIDPWQARLLTALLLTLLVLAPVVWLMARRLTRPIRGFADAARRLGADPEAEPLTPSGPSEVRVAIAAFNDMQGAIRQHVRQRTQTIAAIAHDLRTPLTRLRFRAEQAPDVLRDKMAADVEEMDALIGQAMAFVRGEAQAERLERLDLAALAEACAAGFADTGAAVTFDGQTSLWVCGDPASLKRAVANLIENAVKFADGARVVASSAADQAIVIVSDDGPGLPDEELEAVFEPFHRGERSRNRQTGGAGLGLAVARQAARAVGGDVTLANRPGGGLDAQLALPSAS